VNEVIGLAIGLVDSTKISISPFIISLDRRTLKTKLTSHDEMPFLGSEASLSNNETLRSTQGDRSG
jgi:hypothetical protein